MCSGGRVCVLVVVCVVEGRGRDRGGLVGLGFVGLDLAEGCEDDVACFLDGWTDGSEDVDVEVVWRTIRQIVHCRCSGSFMKVHAGQGHPLPWVMVGAAREVGGGSGGDGGD